jgi:hypothetical protein
VFVIGTELMFNYGVQKNIPKNVHDISRARLSYSCVATNLRGMIPKSMVSSIIGFGDMLQITHLKIQQSIAKAKPDGLIIDIEGLENVQLGRGGELQPLEIQDIYEQAGSRTRLSAKSETPSETLSSWLESTTTTCA